MSRWWIVGFDSCRTIGTTKKGSCFDFSYPLIFNLSFRDFGWQQRYARFCGRVVVLSILSLLLYPFLWAWTVIGTLWFRNARDCVSDLASLHGVNTISGQAYVLANAFWFVQLPEQGQKWGFLIWLLFSYCALLCIACMSFGKVSDWPDYFFHFLLQSIYYASTSDLL